MESILNYENRANLYQFLIEDFGMKIIYENFDSKCFGNFCIRLSSDEFVLSYINDRNFLDVTIESNLKPDEAIPLTFLMNYIYNPQNLNDYELHDNKRRIEKLNEFIKKDFKIINDLINKDNYVNTKNNIEKLLKNQFLEKFPSAISK